MCWPAGLSSSLCCLLIYLSQSVYRLPAWWHACSPVLFLIYPFASVFHLGPLRSGSVRKHCYSVVFSFHFRAPPCVNNWLHRSPLEPLIPFVMCPLCPILSSWLLSHPVSWLPIISCLRAGSVPIYSDYHHHSRLRWCLQEKWYQPTLRPRNRHHTGASHAFFYFHFILLIIFQRGCCYFLNFTH